MRIDRQSFQAWLNDNMMHGNRNIPARLLTLIGLLERLRETPDLDIEAHRTESGTQLIDHNSAVGTALARFQLDSPVQELGRRSNNLNAFAPRLFDWLKTAGYVGMSLDHRNQSISALQTMVMERVSAILDEKPLLVRYNRGTTVAIFTDILDQAQGKNKAKDVAEYLVGAKLELRFGNGIVPQKNVNTPSLGNLADFRIGNTAIEVTVLKKADRPHLDQIAKILKDTGLQVWLLTRLVDRERWQAAIDYEFEMSASRVVVTGIEVFLGQNISELGEFNFDNVRATMTRLFERYEQAWLPRAGAGGRAISGNLHQERLLPCRRLHRRRSCSAALGTYGQGLLRPFDTDRVLLVGRSAPT